MVKFIVYVCKHMSNLWLKLPYTKNKNKEYQKKLHQ